MNIILKSAITAWLVGISLKEHTTSQARGSHSTKYATTEIPIRQAYISEFYHFLGSITYHICKPNCFATIVHLFM